MIEVSILPCAMLVTIIFLSNYAKPGAGGIYHEKDKPERAPQTKTNGKYHPCASSPAGSPMGSSLPAVCERREKGKLC